MKTTLNKIREHSPCRLGWNKLLYSLNKTKADDEPVSIVQIIDSNGLDDALWCLRAVTWRDREIRHYMVWVARQVQHLMTDPRSITALDVAERFADGLATQEELAAARSAAVDVVRDVADGFAKQSELSAAWTAAWVAVWSASGTAVAGVVTRAAAGVVTRAAARASQEKKLRELCAWCDQNPVLAGIGETK